MRELLRPPVHRGPLIAAGAVVLAVGVVLGELRLEDEGSRWLHAALLAGLGAALLALGLQFPLVGGKPASSASALVVAGLLLVLGGMARAAGEIEAWRVTLVALLFGGVALGPAIGRRSAAAALLAALSFVLALLAAWRWAFGAESLAPYRWLLLLSAIALVLFSLALRAPLPRHSTQLINAAGLAMVALAVSPLVGAFALGTDATTVPFFFELMLLGAAFGLFAYGAVDREPGPVVIGLAVLAGFLAGDRGGDATLLGWPLILGAIGLLMLLAGLRPRRPLPPEPELTDDFPLVATSVDDVLSSSGGPPLREAWRRPPRR